MNSFIFNSPIGLLKIYEENGKIMGIRPEKNSNNISPKQKSLYKSDLLYEAYKQLNEYFTGDRQKFNLPISCSGTVFQQMVWNELQNIPYGETRCYGDVALNIGNPGAVRAVGQANGKNPIMIVIPCHRVIHSNGDISGFAWGTDMKKYLLDLERNNKTEKII